MDQTTSRPNTALEEALRAYADLPCLYEDCHACPHWDEAEGCCL